MENYTSILIDNYSQTIFNINLSVDLNLTIDLNDDYNNKRFYTIPIEDVDKVKLKAYIQNFKSNFIESTKRLTKEEKTFVICELINDWNYEENIAPILRKAALNNPIVLRKALKIINQSEDQESEETENKYIKVLESHSLIPIFRSSYIELKSFFLQFENPQNINPKQNPKNLQWFCELNEIRIIYDLLRGDEYKMISSDTSFEQFKQIGNSKKEVEVKQIKWQKSNRLLSYFLDSLFIGQKWQSIIGQRKLFQNSNGKILTKNDFSVAKNNYISYGLPKGSEIIDKILSFIKKP